MRYSARAQASALILAASVVCGAEPEDPGDDIEVVEVIAPLSLDDAAEAQAVHADDIAEQRSLDLADYMKRNLASVFVNEAQSNPLQPDLQYRGYVGSPLLGLPQGIAVYQDGVRINEPFGDTVNWALIPEPAIHTVHLLPGSSPLFGLNALGGAVAIRTKDGFTDRRTAAEALAGSFGRWGLAVQHGNNNGRFGYFATATTLNEDGWRDFSPTEAIQAFATGGWRGEDARLDLGVTFATTDLIGNGPVPVELRAREPTAIYTRPDRTRNDLVQLNLTAQRDFSETVSARGNMYLRDSDIESDNGDDFDSDDPRFNAAVNRTKTEQDGFGFGLQATRSDTLGAGRNRLLAGITYDAADIDFSSNTELGVLDETRLAVPVGLFAPGAATGLAATSDTFSVYLSNTLEPSERFAITATARYNSTHVALADQLGTALNGDHRFSRVNPALSATYQATATVALYGQYSESSRTPSPVELTCADEDAPCRLPNAFLADPPLAQVVARTLEFGVRGTTATLSWRVTRFRTANENDILFISAGAYTNAGYFDHVGDTERQGWEFSVSGQLTDRLRGFAHYTDLQATFEDAFTVTSANHPQAIDGEIPVDPGARLPLVPERLLKAGVSVDLTDRLGVGADLQHVSRQHFRGDEGNLAPGLDPYTLVNLRADYRISGAVTAFVTAENVLDERYATFGVFGEADDVLGDEFEDGRFVSPGAPRAGWLGIELEF